MWPDRLRLLDTTFDRLAENLEFDERLLRDVQSDAASAALRFWEFPRYAVVVGRSNTTETEVDLDACQADDVPVLRRSSGGGAVVIGPGCLCFSLALPIPAQFADVGITGITRAVMECLAKTLTTPDENIAVRGISDLVIHDRKFSGNSQRWLRTAFLHHGTMLYNFDLDRISRYLKSPARQPDYREGRPHHAFVTNLVRSRDSLMADMSRAWGACDSSTPCGQA